MPQNEQPPPDAVGEQLELPTIGQVRSKLEALNDSITADVGSLEVIDAEFGQKIDELTRLHAEARQPLVSSIESNCERAYELAAPVREELTAGKTTAVFPTVTYTYQDDHEQTLTVVEKKGVRKLALQLLRLGLGQFVTKSRPVIYRVDKAGLKQHLKENPERKTQVSEVVVTKNDKFRVTVRPSGAEEADDKKPFQWEKVITS